MTTTEIDLPELMNKSQAASFVGCTVRTLEEYMRAGMIPYIKLGKLVRFSRSDVLAHFNEKYRVVRKHQ